MSRIERARPVVRPCDAGTLPSPRTRRVARFLLAVLLVVVAWITLWPSPVDEGGRSTLLTVLERLHERGVPRWLDYSFVERAANVVMFVPFGALLVVILPPRRWWLALVLPALTSALVEIVQHVALPQRVSSGWDVLANTAGAALGAVAAAVVLALLRRRVPAGPGRADRDLARST